MPRPRISRRAVARACTWAAALITTVWALGRQPPRAHAQPSVLRASPTVIVDHRPIPISAPAKPTIPPAKTPCSSECSPPKRLVVFAAISTSGDESGRMRRRLARETWLRGCKFPSCDYRFFASVDAKLSLEDAMDVVAVEDPAMARMSSRNGTDFVLLADDFGVVCFDRVIDELRVRPLQRFAWTTGCDSTRFSVLSSDVAAAMAHSQRDLASLKLTIFDDSPRSVETTAASSQTEFCETHIHAVDASSMTTRADQTAKTSAENKKRAIPIIHQSSQQQCLFRAEDEEDHDFWAAIDAEKQAEDCCAPSSEKVEAAAHTCSAYRARSMLPARRSATPRGAILASFPGSGNTWSRMLVEYATGVLTGSIYDDDELKRSLPAEGNRNTSQVLLVKAHVMPKQYLTMVTANKIVLVSRHPFSATWAEFQRRIGIYGTTQNSHVHVVQRFGPALNKVFARFALCMSCKWALYALAHAKVDLPVHRVRYENLVKSDDELRKILDFLGFETSERRVKCSRQLAFDPSIRRAKSNMTAVSLFHVSFFTLFMQAAVFGSDKKMACEAWHRITANPASRELVAEMMYTPGDFDCGVSKPYRECADIGSKAGNCFMTVTQRVLDVAKRQDNLRPQSPTSQTESPLRRSISPSRSIARVHPRPQRRQAGASTIRRIRPWPHASVGE